MDGRVGYPSMDAGARMRHYLDDCMDDRSATDGHF